MLDRSRLTRLVLGIVALAPMLALGACNTTRGFGEDVEATGEAVQGTARETEEELEE